MNAKSEKLKDLVDIALSQVGVHEHGGNNDGEVVRMYQSVIGRPEKEPWCVSFVQWCVRQVEKKSGIKTVLFPTESSQMIWLKTPAVARISQPEPGAIVVWTKYKDNKALFIGHVGVVKEVLPGGYMLTIEGNTSPGDGIQREGDGVYIKRRPIHITSGYMRTTGYLLPFATN